MTQKLRAYIDMLFSQAPATKKTVEVKEEILQNLIDKYNDLIAEGKSEEAAYNIAISSIGDISELTRSLRGAPVFDEKQAAENEADKKRRALITAVAVALYILCVVPNMLFRGDVGPVIMFLMIAIATGMLIYNNMTKPKYVKADDTLAEEFREWRTTSVQKSGTLSSLLVALWAMTFVVYFLISFVSMRWEITWLVFLVALAVSFVIKAMFDLKK